MSTNPGDLGGPSSGGGISEWIGEHRNLAIGMGIGGLGLLYLYLKHKGASAPASGATTGYSTGSTAPVYLVGSNPNSPSNSSVSGQGPSAAQLFQQNQAQQSMIDNLLSGGTIPIGGVSNPFHSRVPLPGITAPGQIPVPSQSVSGNTSLGSQTQNWLPPSPSLIKNGAPGEGSFVSSAYDPVTGQVYSLTNDGGVYTTNPATGGMSSGPFYGSAFSVGAGGPNLFSNGQISVLSNGGYQITNNQGQTYTFT